MGCMARRYLYLLSWGIYSWLFWRVLFHFDTWMSWLINPFNIPSLSYIYWFSITCNFHFSKLFKLIFCGIQIIWSKAIKLLLFPETMETVVRSFLMIVWNRVFCQEHLFQKQYRSKAVMNCLLKRSFFWSRSKKFYRHFCRKKRQGNSVCPHSHRNDDCQSCAQC